VQFESGTSIFKEDLQTNTTTPDMTARFHSAMIAVPLQANLLYFLIHHCVSSISIVNAFQSLEKFTENYLGDLRSRVSIMLHHDLRTSQTNPLVG
jgi:hypothetical protein